MRIKKRNERLQVLISVVEKTKLENLDNSSSEMRIFERIHQSRTHLKGIQETVEKTGINLTTVFSNENGRSITFLIIKIKKQMLLILKQKAIKEKPN